MKTPLATPEGARLREQARRFELRHACDHCVHFDDRLELCGHGYPTAPHRLPREPALAAAGELVFVFCKEFELG